MDAKQLQDVLQPGDCLLYRPKSGSVFGWLIARKTWHNISHCELYVGKGKSAASRDGIGVGQYPLRETELCYILRPAYPLDWAAFWRWFKTVDGQKYDWFGLLRFAYTKSGSTGKNDKQFCSEFEARAYRMLGAKVFNDSQDADAIVPASFLYSPNLVMVDLPK
jgi:hypothetical protein